MEKIIFEDFPSTKTPINAENLNKMQENVEIKINEIEINNSKNETDINEINNKFIFSKEEQIIGNWINGKNIYRKVIESNVSELGQISINLQELNYETIWINQGKSLNQYDGDSTSSAINWYNGENDYGLIYINTGRNLTIKNNSNHLRKYYITIEYTKKTD